MFDDADFDNSSSQFKCLISAAVDVSDKSGGIQTSTLGIEATKIYTRLTLSAMTIEKVLPNNSKLWDFPSIAILTRSFVETTHRHCYLAETDLTEDEETFRRKLYFYHLNMEKFRLYSAQPEHEILTSFKEALPRAKKELEELPFFSTLSKYFQNKIISGNADMHISDEVIAKNSGLITENYSFYYRLLSNHSHGSPFATTSQSNVRGRGFKNDTELFYITLALQILNKYLSYVIQQQVRLLSLESKCKTSMAFAKDTYEKSAI